MIYWVAYWAGAILTLAAKLAAYLWARIELPDPCNGEEGGGGHSWKEKEKKLRRHWKVWTIEWFLGSQRGVQGSKSPLGWVTTVGVVWLVGALVVNEAVAAKILPEWMDLPGVHLALVFVVGSLGELIAPPVAEMLTGAVTGLFRRKEV